MKADVLFIYTHSYPFGNGEQFLKSELKILAGYYKKVILVPAFIDGNERVIDEKNVEVFKYKNEGEANIKVNYFKLVKIFIGEVIKSEHRINYFLNARYYLAFIKNAYKKALNLYQQIIKSHPNSTQYTYWFGDETFQLCILKSERLIKKVVTRGHGGDIYEYQHIEPNFFFPFRYYQFHHIDKIAVVSKNGVEHLKRNFPAYNNKLSLNYLACEKFNSIENKQQTFTLLSCSTFYHYKRIPFLIDTLKLCKVNLHWIHIGDGGDEKELAVEKLKDLPDNITYKWLGYLDQQQLHQFYQNMPIDLFINVSNSEGLPVTLMEAISAGIPIMATKVGGVSEIANEHTGVLIEKDILPVKLAKLIDSIVSKTLQLPPSEKIIDFWQKNFSVNNYNTFYSEVLCAE